MKANELMIGDWVHFTNSLNEEWDAKFAIIDFMHGTFSRVDPIPLTAEILEKNNLPSNRVAWWYADDFEDADDRITYEIHISEGALGINGFMWYVHELQHALRLCGLNDLADNFKV